MDSDITLGVKSNESISLYQAYNKGFIVQADFIVKYIGCWFKPGKFILNKSLSTYEERKNMSNTHLRIATVVLINFFLYCYILSSNSLLYFQITSFI